MIAIKVAVLTIGTLAALAIAYSALEQEKQAAVYKAVYGGVK